MAAASCHIEMNFHKQPFNFVQVIVTNCNMIFISAGERFETTVF